MREPQRREGGGLSRDPLREPRLGVWEALQQPSEFRLNNGIPTGVEFCISKNGLVVQGHGQYCSFDRIFLNVKLCISAQSFLNL